MTTKSNEVLKLESKEMKRGRKGESTAWHWRTVEKDETRGDIILEKRRGGPQRSEPDFLPSTFSSTAQVGALSSTQDI